MQEDKRHGSDSWVRKIPWRRAWQPTPVSLPGESHGQKSLEGYSPWVCTESGTTEATGHGTRKLDNGRQMLSNAGKNPKGNLRSASENGEKPSSWMVERVV